MRNVVGAHHLETARLPAQHVERGAHCLHNQMPLVAPNVISSLTGNVDDKARLGDADDDVVIQRKSETETVETWAEVGTRGGHPHPRRCSPKGDAH